MQKVRKLHRTGISTFMGDARAEAPAQKRDRSTAPLSTADQLMRTDIPHQLAAMLHQLNLAILLRLERAAQALALVTRTGGHDEANNESVETEGLCEDKDEDHANKEAGLLRICPHTCVSDNADGKAGCKRRETDGKSCAEVSIARVGRVLIRACVDVAVDDDGSDETIDSQHTCHDHGDDGAHHHVWAHDTHRHNADA